MTTSQAVENAVRRYVPTSAGGTIASGVVIGTGYVLTCFHSLRVDQGIKVGEVDAEIVGVDPLHDLAILAVKTVEIEPIVLGVTVLGETVFAVGNPIGLSGALLFGRVCYQTDKQIVHDIHGTPGISGSALWDCDGELVGINHSVVGRKGVGNWLTVAVPAFHAQKVLRLVFKILQPTESEVQKYGQADDEKA